MTNYRSEFLHFRGLNASIFVIFFFKWVRISHRFHFFTLEHQQMKSDGRTMRTTVRTVRAYEYGGSFGDSRRRKQEIVCV